MSTAAWTVYVGVGKKIPYDLIILIILVKKQHISYHNRERD